MAIPTIVRVFDWSPLELLYLNQPPYRYYRNTDMLFISGRLQLSYLLISIEFILNCE